MNTENGEISDTMFNWERSLWRCVPCPQYCQPKVIFIYFASYKNMHNDITLLSSQLCKDMSPTYRQPTVIAVIFKHCFRCYALKKVELDESRKTRRKVAVLREAR